MSQETYCIHSESFLECAPLPLIIVGTDVQNFSSPCSPLYCKLPGHDLSYKKKEEKRTVYFRCECKNHENKIKSSANTLSTQNLQLQASEYILHGRLAVLLMWGPYSYMCLQNTVPWTLITLYKLIFSSDVTLN